MSTGQTTSIVDQLFNAIDTKNDTIARYKLCRAIEKASETVKPETDSKTAPDCEGQA